MLSNSILLLCYESPYFCCVIEFHTVAVQKSILLLAILSTFTPSAVYVIKVHTSTVYVIGFHTVAGYVIEFHTSAVYVVKFRTVAGYIIVFPPVAVIYNSILLLA